MTRELAERRVKSLQKALLCWLEEHEALRRLDPEAFNALRRGIIRSSFGAYRLGVVGIGDEEEHRLWVRFVGWVAMLPALTQLSPELSAELMGRCFRCSLEAFRLGALVAGGALP